MTGGIDPKNVKPGDMVTLSRGNSTARGAVTHVQDFLHLEELGRYRVKGLGDGTRTGGYTEWTLTAHQPAPEPEPEWEPGTVADITVDFDTHRAIRAEIGVWRTVGNKSFTDSRVDEVAPLVVIDPATVDRTQVAQVIRGEGEPGTFDYIAADAVLGHLGIEVPR